jgi:hypothetical protein
MKKQTTVLIMIIFAMIIAIPSLLHYSFYKSWIGLIGWGIGLALISISVRLRKKEMIEQYKKMSEKGKKVSNIFKIVLWIILGISVLISLFLLFIRGDIKAGLFCFETVALLFFAFWKMP